ncbi:MAG: beta-ACP synthase [Bacteroidia bacterium]|nr:MAG: beta-ACP synthase [Bacteroidia bacterium]
MDNSVYITGIGIISSIGNNVSENLNSLRQQKTGIGKIKDLPTIHKDEIPVGQISLDFESLKKDLGLDPRTAYSATTLPGMKAAKEALENAKITDINSAKTGLISATTVGGMRETEQFYTDFLSEGKHKVYINKHEVGNSTQQIADYLKITDFVTTISTACSSSANALMLGARLIRQKHLDRVIAGGTDVLSKFTLNGFHSLKILDKNLCRPFDADRQGLNLGEAAAYLVLESESSLRKSKKTPLARLSGYANANDAYHQTASSPEGTGAFLAMQQALSAAGLQTEDIDYINAHGTGTPNNDLTESLALKQLFGKKIPPFSSTKTYTGHTLAAAGAVEAVYSVLALQHNLIFPNLRFQNKIEEIDIFPEVQLIENKHIKNVLSNSFGFGGNDTSLIFSKIQ